MNIQDGDKVILESKTKVIEKQKEGYNLLMIFGFILGFGGLGFLFIFGTNYLTAFSGLFIAALGCVMLILAEKKFSEKTESHYIIRGLA